MQVLCAEPLPVRDQDWQYQYLIKLSHWWVLQNSGFWVLLAAAVPLEPPLATRKGDLCPFQHGPPLELPSFTGTELPAAFKAEVHSLDIRWKLRMSW